MEEKVENNNGESNASTSAEQTNNTNQPMKLSLINGKINDMKIGVLKKNLKRLGLSTNGTEFVLKKRLKNHYRKNLLPENSLILSKLYPYFVVVDYEATCLTVNPPNFPHEIIEFPGVLVDAKKHCIVDVFHEYVKPKLNPKLSKFCTELTGITQDMVDNAKPFPEVLAQFDSWLKKHQLGTTHKFALVTDGSWDMSRFLHQQCKMSGVPYPSYAIKWLNLKRPFRNYYNCPFLNLPGMLGFLGIEFEGRHHCGLDDSKNIANILIHLIKDGASLETNESLTSIAYKQNLAIQRNKKNPSHKKKNQPNENPPKLPDVVLEDDIEFAMSMMSIQNES